MYLGNQPALAYTSLAKQDFTTSATTSYVLDNPVANANEIALFINFVRQEPTTAYTASGTTLTLTSATSVTDDMYCVFLGKAVQTVNPPAGSVGISQLSATGTPSASTFLRGDNSFASAGGIFESQLLHVREELAAGTDSATLSPTGTYLTRVINTVKTNEITGASLASNQITLPSGTYFIMASLPAYVTSNHKGRLRNITDSITEVQGTTEHAWNNGYTVTHTFINGRFTLSGIKVLEIQHRAGQAGSGGTSYNSSENEIYANAMIWKVA